MTCCGGLDDFRRETIEWEERDNERFTREFTAPLLTETVGPPSGRAAVLSVGCGVGTDVETLVDMGWDAQGVEPGYRNTAWSRRRIADRLHAGDGRELPFGDASFDALTAFGVIEHVGAVGDTVDVHPTYREDRARFARECARVVRPGGVLLVSTPNRLHPADYFHSPNRFGMRWHSLREPFSVSWGDLRELFIDEAGCRRMRHLSLANAFVFRRSREHLWGRVLAPVARVGLAGLGARPLEPLARSPLNPFLAVRIDR